MGHSNLETPSEGLGWSSETRTGSSWRHVLGELAMQTELMAAIEGLHFAIDMGFTDAILEMDAQDCINSILSTEECNGIDGLLIEEVNYLLHNFRAVVCQWTPRCGNKVAHTLAQFAFHCNEFVTWIEEAPRWLLLVLEADVLSLEC
ncbi:uncharacterized protein LOC109946742 [Prunus persica]|uniref:uncharacterized protein LOC109946742 n=1 Tax=Prunus persica TaxID=3760 RepID=UPI0009AB3506|nr:uncharacterized protein LOC109946742 [Prunus persica]